ncbi:hypothetical protein NLJ89_g2685 [Agrocybe chaxingu]|uniref:O-fucosyltransferase family protein n=1 Tax=Agrocybe chaxingu TaxID=84603 RepID=A0A9W8K6C0_9AGAR|nr:hypothetical protein NLJ89_g2685 [Agrocybe chaxingu]
MQVVFVRGLAGVGALFLLGISLCILGLQGALQGFQLSLIRGKAIADGQAPFDVDMPLDKPTKPKDMSKCGSEDAHIRPIELVVPEWDSSRFLKGPPAKHFRDNLRDDAYYITAWSNAGFTNQFMSYVNMIYMGIISDRIPIISPFGPDDHISYEAGTLQFSRVFNLTQAKKTLNRPLLEWHELKQEGPPTSVLEPAQHDGEALGCWSTRHETDPNPLRVRSVVTHLKLDIAYTRIPLNARHSPDNKDHDFLVFNQLVPYIYPKNPWQKPSSFPLMQASPLGKKLPPDEQLACFDFLYYVTSSREEYEWRFSWSPAWRMVATHLRFTGELMSMAEGYLRRAFQVPDRIPPFIAVHMRRGDFGRQCWDGRTPEQCFVPLESYRKAVESVQKELLEKKGIQVERVVLMSDELDSKFWEETHKLGWSRFDHREERTLEKYGEWYPPLIDSVAQSMAAGFVGTGDSTYSLVSARRVEDWNGGPAVMVPRN